MERTFRVGDEVCHFEDPHRNSYRVYAIQNRMIALNRVVTAHPWRWHSAEQFDLLRSVEQQRCDKIDTLCLHLSE